MNTGTGVLRIFRRISFNGALTLILIGNPLQAGKVWSPPEGFSIPESTLSPDGSYGVLVPGWKKYIENGAPQNQLVNVKTGQVLATIQAETWVEDETSQRRNHMDLEACWSKDGTVLGWVIGGKWFPAACVLLKITDGKVAWQVNVLKRSQQEMLSRTKAAAPKNYAAAKKQNEGSGRFFPEGFTVDIGTPQKDFTLPWRGRTTLDSNPKSIADGWPADANVSAAMNFVVQADGSIVFSDFSIDPKQTGIPRSSGDN